MCYNHHAGSCEGGDVQMEGVVGLNSWETVLEELIGEETLIHGVFSDPEQKDSDTRRVIIRPFVKKGIVIYQLEFHRGKQVFHSNMEGDAVRSELTALIKETFRQVQLFGKRSDFQVRRSRKGQLAILRKAPSRKGEVAAHNRTKQYLIPEGVPVPWMVRLGIMTPEGKVVRSRYDKFRQINRYLEFIEDALKHLDTSRTVEIIDFGCGKAYLTYALYDYLVRARKLKANVVGLDLKSDVIDECAKLAEELGYDGLHFKVGDIACYEDATSVDMVISLHACDTATDEALAKAVKWGARVILAVPCCHKELVGQVNVPGLEPMLKHGIIRDRFGSMATDALRVLALEAAGYNAGIMEFIDMEHTPKNLLIRAIRSEHRNPDATEKFFMFKKTIGVEGRLENAFSEFLKQGK